LNGKNNDYAISILTSGRRGVIVYFWK